MLFILPLGIILYFFDKKTYRANIETFNAYVEKIKASDLEVEEKRFKIDAMYYENGYHISAYKEGLRVCKKHFNPGVLLIFFGVGSYLGPLLYAIYYFKLLKPICHDIEFS